ncbi:hypothetical protein FB45DRAFT_876256 [Roridomyces roridus]|uniref:Uncharacterized protein n=1 Tax=Roridomyces roridus TaxID=1738132 RepID=A0AAD7B3T0_9AGAR|nr:hypothetical protein FB45DRAFT_876256 [Roridomyces roridus]
MPASVESYLTTLSSPTRPGPHPPPSPPPSPVRAIHDMRQSQTVNPKSASSSSSFNNSPFNDTAFRGPPNGQEQGPVNAHPYPYNNNFSNNTHAGPRLNVNDDIWNILRQAQPVAPPQPQSQATRVKREPEDTFIPTRPTLGPQKTQFQLGGLPSLDRIPVLDLDAAALERWFHTALQRCKDRDSVVLILGAQLSCLSYADEGKLTPAGREDKVPKHPAPLDQSLSAPRPVRFGAAVVLPEIRTFFSFTNLLSNGLLLGPLFSLNLRPAAKCASPEILQPNFREKTFELSNICALGSEI